MGTDRITDIWGSRTTYAPGQEWPVRVDQFLRDDLRAEDVYHFHTRTKTKRAQQLQDAAPSVWVELSRQDAARLGVSEGDVVRVTSRRGHINAPARVSHVREGVVTASAPAT